jgi:acetyl esterase
MSELHPEVRSIVEQDRAEGVPRSSSLSVEGARSVHVEGFAFPEEPTPVGDVSEYRIPGPGGPLPVRVYEPDGEGPFPALLYIHGGGWVLGNLEGVDELCRRLANAADCAVVSVDYRLAPEHPFPAPVEDCSAALRWIAENPGVAHADPDRLAVAGDSAGGNLAAAVSLLARDRDGPDLDYQVLIYPVTNHAFDTESYEENAEGYLLTKRDMEWFWDHYLERDLDGRNPYASPLRARDLSGLPPATVVTAGFDPLRDDGLAYADRLAEAGVAVERRNHEDMIHGFVTTLVDPELERATAEIERIGEEVRGAFDADA